MIMFQICPDRPTAKEQDFKFGTTIRQSVNYVYKVRLNCFR